MPQIFFSTAGVVRTFFQTAKNLIFFSGGNVRTSLFTTENGDIFFRSGALLSNFLTTAKDKLFFRTSTAEQHFFDTPEPVDKGLVLKFGEVTLAQDCGSIILRDGTGVFDSDTNPTGYQPEDDPADPLRAKRSELQLWLVYKVWDAEQEYNLLNIQFPGTQDGALTPWEYTLQLDKQGIYQFWLIGAPLGFNYDDWKIATLPQFAKEASDWYVGELGFVVGCNVSQCYINARDRFLQAEMIGNCFGEYEQIKQLYGAMYEATALLEYDKAKNLYNKLNDVCFETGCCKDCKVC